MLCSAPVQARKVEDTPFPFPYAQLLATMLYAFALIFPLVVASKVGKGDADFRLSPNVVAAASAVDGATAHAAGRSLGGTAAASPSPTGRRTAPSASNRDRRPAGRAERTARRNR